MLLACRDGGADTCFFLINIFVCDLFALMIIFLCERCLVVFSMLNKLAEYEKSFNFFTQYKCKYLSEFQFIVLNISANEAVELKNGIDILINLKWMKNLSIYS